MSFAAFVIGQLLCPWIVASTAYVFRPRPRRDPIELSWEKPCTWVRDETYRARMIKWARESGRKQGKIGFR